jgi:hypothetical protein
VTEIIDAPATTAAATQRRTLAGHVLRWLGVEHRDTRLIWPFEAMFLAIGRLWVILLFGTLFAIFAVSVARSEYFGPTTLVEEAAHTYTSANNYLRFGIWPTVLLQDFATSSDPADHPYAYNHMPPGPDLLMALLLKISGGSYRATRLAFGVLFLVGLVFYLKFAGLILEGIGLARGHLYAVMFLEPWLLFANFERHNVAVAPLLMFAPFVSLIAYYRTGRRRYLVAMVVLVFASSIYLEYIAMLANVVSWTLLYLTGLVRIERRHFGYVLAAFATGIAGHLLQNVAYLGPTVFLEELRLVLLNRISGYPTKDELKGFYQAVGLVHHGASPVQLTALLAQLATGLRFTGRSLIIQTAIVLAIWHLVRARWVTASAVVLVPDAIRKSYVVRVLGKLVLWAVVASILPLCLFPAFAQEVSLYGNGANLFFLAIAATAVLLFTVRSLSEGFSEQAWNVPVPHARLLVQGVVSVMLVGSLLFVAALSAKTHINSVKAVIAATAENRYRLLSELRNRFAGQTFMTNINVTTVGFLLQERGWGVCGPQSVPETGRLDPMGCHSSYVRRPQNVLASDPRYFIFFWSVDLFPGFSDCLPSAYFPGDERGGDSCIAELYKRLSGRFRPIYENKLVIVFDLHSKRLAALR